MFMQVQEAGAVWSSEVTGRKKRKKSQLVLNSVLLCPINPAVCLSLRIMFRKGRSWILLLPPVYFSASSACAPSSLSELLLGVVAVAGICAAVPVSAGWLVASSLTHPVTPTPPILCTEQKALSKQKQQEGEDMLESKIQCPPV